MTALCAVCIVLSFIMLFHSISGLKLVGCANGSGCDSVMSSSWGYIFGYVPVSIFAACAYLVMVVCVLFLSGKENDKESLDCIVQPVLLLISGCIIGCALWFSYIQVFELKKFCKYCMAAHSLGCIAAAYTIVYFKKQSVKTFLPAFAGLAAASLFALVQTKTMPTIIYDNGTTQSALPSFKDGEVPSIGPEDAEYTINLMFDFQCNHCRKIHKFLPEMVEKSGGTIRFNLCPVSLSNECNPYIPGGIDRFAGSCTYVRLAMAIWYHFPEKYEELAEWMMGSGDENLIIDPVEAVDHIGAIVGEDELAAALSDARIVSYMNRCFELFGRTTNSEKSGIPRFIYGQQWIVPETDSADELLNLLQSTFLVE